MQWSIYASAVDAFRCWFRISDVERTYEIQSHYLGAVMLLTRVIECQ